MTFKRIKQLLLGAILVSFILLIVIGFDTYVKPLFAVKKDQAQELAKSQSSPLRSNQSQKRIPIIKNLFLRKVKKKRMLLS